MFFFQALLLFAAAVGPTSAWASPPLKEQPGYIEFTSLGLFDDPEPEANVEIYLKKPLLDLVAAATRSEDEELANMLAGLNLICVQVYKDLDMSYEHIAARLSALSLPDWEQAVQVRERDQRVQFYVRTKDETIVGLLVLAGDPHEFVFINIVGSLDLAQVGRIGRKFDIAPLDSIDFGAATPQAPRQD
jgi:hypothetical protein